jgi:hypothetical protein
MIGGLLAALWAWLKGLSGTGLFSFVAFIFACASAGAFFIDKRRLTRVQLKAALKTELESQFIFEKITPEIWWKGEGRDDIYPLTVGNPAPDGASLIVVVTTVLTSVPPLSIDRAELRLEGQDRFPILHSLSMFRKVISRQDEIIFRFDTDSNLPLGPYVACLCVIDQERNEKPSFYFSIRIFRSYVE